MIGRREVVAGLIVTVVFTLAVGLGVKTITTLPDHALVFADDVSLTYATAPCVLNGKVARQYVVNVQEFVRGAETTALLAPTVFVSRRGLIVGDYRPDPVCRDADGFTQWQPFLLSLFFPPRHRVDEDGTVLW